MEIIEPSIKLLNLTRAPLKLIEKIGRTCYKSESKITDDSAEEFVEKLIDNGHLSMIEHASASYKIITDRAVSHQLVRHRVASFAQESQRYVNYGDRGLQFIKPEIDCSYEFTIWKEAMSNAEEEYLELLHDGAPPEVARTVLPNSTKTEIVITMNFREWRHFFELRCSSYAYPPTRHICYMILQDLKSKVNIIFDDIDVSVDKAK